MSYSFMEIHEDRIKVLREEAVREGAAYVLYWMQQSQRAEWNHAFEYAARLGNEISKPVVVGFGIMDDYPEANARHYTFMAEGLKELQGAFAERNCRLVIRRGSPEVVALDLARDAAAIVCDCGYLRHQRKWRRKVAREAGCLVVQVESDVAVPVETASGKQEYAARTIRRKLMSRYEEFLEEPAPVMPAHSSLNLDLEGEEITGVSGFVESLNIDHSVAPVSEHFRGGTSRAKARFHQFLDEQLTVYDEHRNQAQTDDTSHMSMYLHFGMISPCYLLQQARKRRAGENVDSFVEELLVRRELGVNFCYFQEDYYDSYKCLPGWAYTTLEEHKDDEREYLYTRDELENARTHDPCWNAAMLEMKHTGYMHNYMRMYWGKQILAWTNTPRHAYQTTLYLNNKYFLDGRDCNSFANVAWIYGLHDRPWQERPVFGKVRIMTASGLERKFDPRKYIGKVEQRTGKGVLNAE
jgi:deoxyribodipyrimidine photo-lyase